MPRIYNSASDPIDFCKRCFPKSEANAEKQYGDVSKTGDGPDGRGNCFGYNEEHPPYEECDYNCEKCNKTLTENDN